MYAVETAERVMLQTKAYEKLVKVGHDKLEILLDESQQFDALFIVVTASVYEWDEVVNEYMEQALIQYVTSVYYDKIYGSLIPPELKSKASLLRGGAQ